MRTANACDPRTLRTPRVHSPRAGDVSDGSEELVSDSESSAGSAVVAAVAQESFIAHAESNVAALQAELAGLAAQLPVVTYEAPLLAPHTQAVLRVGTALLVASGLISDPEDDDEDPEEDDDAPASPTAPPRRLPSPPPPPPPAAGHAIMV